MPLPTFRVLAGVIDGVNRIFTTPVDYETGSVRVFLNGQLKRQDFDDGWVELGANAVELDIAPEVEDVVQAYFISA